MSAIMKYWAFISYSHQDTKACEWLHRELETFRVPRRIVGRETREGKAPSRIFPVFRDRDELPGSAELGKNLAEALAQSRYLIVICSPSSARSRWVNEEIRQFKAMGGEGRVLALIIDGEPNAADRPDSGLLECFPEALKFRVDEGGNLLTDRVEPIAADIRKGRETRAIALLRLIAGLLGVPFDELRQRDKERTRRALTLRVIASAVVATLLAGAALWTYRDDRMARLEELGREALMQGQPTHAAVYLAQAYQMGNQSRTLKIMLEQAMRSVDMLSTVHIDDADGYIGAMFSDDGTRLLGSSKTGQIVVWRADNGHTLLRFKADAGPSRTARFMPGGQHIAVLYTDGRVELRDARSGDPLRQGRVPPGYLPHSDPSPAHLAVYRKAKTAENAEQLMVFDLMRLQPVREITQTCAESLSPISPDGQSFYCLARGEGQTGVQVFSLGTAAKPHKLLDGTQVHRLALSLDGRTAVASTGDGELKAISLATHKLLRSVRDPAGGSPALAISEDGQWFAAGGETGTLLVWQIVSGELTAVLPAGSNAIKEVHFLGGSSRLANLGYDGSLKLWNLQNSSLVSAAEPRQGYLVRSALTVDGERMATFADARGDLVGENMDAALKVWDLLAVGPLHNVGDARSKSQRTTVVPRREAVSRFESVTACDQRIRLDARADNSMLVTDLTGKRPVATLYDDTGSTSAIDCDSPLDWYVTGGANGDAILWSARTTQPILRFKGHSKNIANVRFLQDFGRFVTTGTDGTVLQWSFAQESRHPATVARRIACRIPLVLDGYTLKPQRIDRNACLSERIW